MHFIKLPIPVAHTQLLTNGAKVRLWSFAHGMNVRITESGTVDGKGWSALFGKWSIVCIWLIIFVGLIFCGLKSSGNFVGLYFRGIPTVIT